MEFKQSRIMEQSEMPKRLRSLASMARSLSSVVSTSTRQRCCLPCSTTAAAGAIRLDRISIAHDFANPSGRTALHVSDF